MHNLERYSLHRNQSIPINKLIKQGSDFLYDNDICNAKNELEWFLQDLLECDKINLKIDGLGSQNQKVFAA